VIFTVDLEANTFIQLVGKKDDAKLYAETPSNRVIPDGHQLSEDQNDRLEVLGWQSPTGDELNYHRTWRANSHEDRLMTAQEIMQTFVEVYGVEPDQPLDVNLNLE